MSDNLNVIAVAGWAVIVGFRVKEMLEDDVPPGTEISVESVIQSERLRDMFEQRKLSDEVRRLVRAIFVGTAEIYPHLLTVVATNQGEMFIRSIEEPA